MIKVTVIGTFGIKPGCIDEFISLQREFATSRCLDGLLGGRMYRNRAGTKAVLVSQFESAQAQQAIAGSAELQAHIGTLREMVESSSPDVYEVAYTYGAFE
jgi:quinol monooxygenase YgiN